jgi:hypothetical protein
VLKNMSAAAQRCSGSLKTQALQRYSSVLQNLVEFLESREEKRANSCLFPSRSSNALQCWPFKPQAARCSACPSLTMVDYFEVSSLSKLCLQTRTVVPPITRSSDSVASYSEHLQKLQ